MALRENDLANTVLKKISVDEFEPKTGTSENVLVLGFQLSENLLTYNPFEISSERYRYYFNASQ